MTTHSPRPAPKTPGFAFTLLEVMVAMAVFSILLMGLVSAVALSSRAIPDGRRGASATVVAGRAAEQIAADLACATSLATAAGREIVFTVDDRTGDGAPDTLRYFWSGNAGDPLLRQCNGGSPAALAGDVREFQLAYRQQPFALPPASAEGAEQTLAYYRTTWFEGDAQVSAGTWHGQCFRPDLPAGATSWRVTRVRFRARSAGPATGAFKLQIRSAEGGLPTSNVIDEVSFLESALTSSYAWREAAFSRASGLTPGAAVCIVFRGAADETCCELEHQSVFAYKANTNFAKSTDGGVQWTAPPGQNLYFYAYGTVCTANPTAWENRLTGVETALRCGPDAGSRISTSARTLNQPPMP